MPTYKSLGISASLSVSELNTTLSDGIKLRMGSDHQDDADRIKLQLANGRTLRERPCGNADGKVSTNVMQFVGDNEDMILFVVVARDKEEAEQRVQTFLQQETDIESACKNLTSAMRVRTLDLEKQLQANLDPSDATNGTLEDGNLSKRKRSSIRQREIKDSQAGNSTRNNDQASANKRGKGKSTKHMRQFEKLTTSAGSELISRSIKEQTTSSQRAPDGPLALDLSVDCTKFLERGKDHGPLSRKDLKFEVYLNGQLVEVSYENLRRICGRYGKRGGFFQFSGTRFHRQSEKPWVYVPTKVLEKDDGQADLRWSEISAGLQQEATARGTNVFQQRPISAQYLIALSRMDLPEDLKGHTKFAVVDLLITAGRGCKYGPETSYIFGPTRMEDNTFSEHAPILDGLGPYRELDGEITMECDDLISCSLPVPSFMTETAPTQPQQPCHPPSPQKPRSMYKRATQAYRDVLDGADVKNGIHKYEGSQGRTKGTRTLRQRLGDMLKMSTQRRRDVLDDMKDDLDPETLNIIKKALQMDDSPPDSVPMPPRKQVRFVEENIMGALDGAQENDKQKSSSAVNTSKLDGAAVEQESLAGAQRRPSTSRLTLPDRTLRNTRADALANSPISFSVENSYPGGVRSALSDPTLNGSSEKSPVLDPALTASESSTPCGYFQNPFTAAATQSATQDSVYSHAEATITDFAPQDQVTSPTLDSPTRLAAQGHVSGANRTRLRWNPNEKTADQALKDFQIPDLCKGSAVTYAEGMAQRQVEKARGGEFHEEDIVVGMRFIVI